MLVIGSLCSAHFLERRRPLLLHFPSPLDHSFPGAHSGTEVAKEDKFACPGCYRNHIIQGPVVQSVVSLTSSLRVISLTILADSIYNILIFFAEKM